MAIEKYKLYESKVILKNYDAFLHQCDIVYADFQKKYKTQDSTWTYEKYNIFSFSASSTLFYDLFVELRGFIRDYLGPHQRIWINSWMNYHKYENIKSLDYHNHFSMFHGYISVDPKNTQTLFPNQNYDIVNRPGQVYMGIGGDGYEHAVQSLVPYEGNRITIAFDLILNENDNYSDNVFIPLI